MYMNFTLTSCDVDQDKDELIIYKSMQNLLIPMGKNVIL